MLAFTNIYCGVAFWLVYMIWAVSELTRAVILRPGKDAKRHDRGSRPIVMAASAICAWIAFYVVFALPGAAIAGNSPIVFAIGLTLMVAGMAFRWYAVRTLGRFFTFEVAVCPDQRVVQTGPYRYIRHPSYTGTLVTLIGLGLALTNWVSLAVILLISSSGLLYRIHVEEHALMGELGQPYLDYMSRTRRLIPFLF
jgi:protein-S-isoprenylcysteine O-methyltransferase